MVHHDPESQRDDLLLLLSLAKDPRAMSHELRKSDRAWLRNAEGRLSFDRFAAIGADRTSRARLALRLLLNE